MSEDIFQGLGVEVSLPSAENFLKVKETLTRIGIASRKDMKLYQSYHILHKRGRYSIFHFKELFLLDGNAARTDLTQEDVQRRNTIVSLLDEWNLVSLVGVVELLEDKKASLRRIKIVSFREKAEWDLVAKYTIGNKSNGTIGSESE